MILHQRFAEGLATTSYIVGDEHTGEAAVSDPTRNVGEFVHFAWQNRRKIRHVFETQLHADFVSGSCGLKERVREEITIHDPGLGGKEWTPPYAGHVTKGNDEIAIGPLRSRAPGVTVLLIICFMLIAALARSAVQAELHGSAVVTLLHTNDIHGHLTAWRGWEGDLHGKMVGGMDRIAAAVKQVRKEVGADKVLLLDSGDALGDTTIADLTKGRAILDAMNAIGYDAMTIGNHEPDFTMAGLRDWIGKARFPVVAANLSERAGGTHFVKPYIVREVAGVKVGILGLAYPHTPLTTAAKNVEGVEFGDPVETARRFVPEVRREGAQIVVALTHLGLGAEKKLAEAVAGIDVIVGGHSHNRMTDSLRVNGALIVQAGAHGSDVGRLDLEIAGGRIVKAARQLIPMRHDTVPSDPEMAKLIVETVAPHQAMIEERLTETASVIPRAQTLAGQEARKRDEESPADSLFCDILCAETGAEIALLPGVGYGVAIGPGVITAADLRNLIPHNSKVVLLSLTGAQIRSILEQSLENTLTDDPQKKVGGIIQVGGLSFRYNAKVAAGSRVLEVRVGDASIESERTYRVATNSMLAAGGHRYRTFTEGKDQQERGLQYELIADWMKRQARVEAPKPGRIMKAQPLL